jgi:hypothetical protein
MRTIKDECPPGGYSQAITRSTASTIVTGTLFGAVASETMNCFVETGKTLANEPHSNNDYTDKVSHMRDGEDVDSFCERQHRDPYGIGNDPCKVDYPQSMIDSICSG